MYFGCWRQAGHHLYTESGDMAREYYLNRHGWLTGQQLDGSPAFLPRHERPGDGAITYLPAPDLTVLAWWGNPWDSRPKVNTAVMVRGRHRAADLWADFNRRFTIAGAITRPTLVAGEPDLLQ